MTLTLDFQGQILKMLYLRNGKADQHGMKGIGVDKMSYLVCDLELWLWPCQDFEGQILKEALL